MLRAKEVLLKLNKEFPNKKIIIFSHSMFGTACRFLLGQAQCFENEKYLAFDGKSKNGEYYVMPNAKPILLNFSIATPKLKAKL